MKWKNVEICQIISNLSLGGSLEIRAGIGAATGRSSDSQARRKCAGFLLAHLPGPLDNQ